MSWRSERCGMRRRQDWSPAGWAVAVIGGANGIGREVVRQLVAGGSNVAVGDRGGVAARATAAEMALGAGAGVRGAGAAIGLDVDVTDTGSVTAFLDAAEAELGPLDVVVNPAGVLWVGPFLEESETTVKRQVQVNLLGAMRVVRLTSARMVERGGGHVLTLA